MEPTQISNPGWTNDDLRASLKEFVELYKQRPIENNRGGMKSPHLFPTWFLIKRMQPESIIESGTFKGQGTFFMEQAAPKSKIFSIEPLPEQIKWKSGFVSYSEPDFADWHWDLTGQTLIHFDDHQNALHRIKQMKARGFKYAMFEDNYPTWKGDCYSLKKCFEKGGVDASYLKQNLKVYYEFPPIFKLPLTRWGDEWSNYKTPNPLYEVDGEGYEDWMAIFVGEAQYYTWICYIELK